MKARWIAIDDFLRNLLRRLGILINEGQQALGQYRQVPVHDPRLVGPGVAPLPVNRTEASLGIEVVHEGAGTIIDGLSAQERIVGIQDAMHEAEYLPMCDQPRKMFAYAFEQGHGGRLVTCLCCRAKMAVDHIIHQRRYVIAAAGHGEVLHGADAQMTAGHPGQNGAGFDLVSHHGFARGDGGECPGRRDTERVHGLGHEVLADHRADRGSPVTASGISGRPRALELNIESRACRRQPFS